MNIKQRPFNQKRDYQSYLQQAIIIIASLLILVVFSNCSGGTVAPSLPSYSSISSQKSGLYKSSTSTISRTIVKTGSLRIKAKNIRETGEAIESIVNQAEGYMTSMSEHKDTSSSANYSIRIPAANLIIAMDQIAELGKVTHRKIYVDDVTQEVIRSTARLNTLRARRDRLKKLYYQASEIEDKLEIESTLSEIEEEIFNMEEAIKAIQKTAEYSKLTLSVSILQHSSAWSLKKLFTIRE